LPGRRGQVASVDLGGRRAARERALELLYECELKQLSPSALLAELPVEPTAYAAELVRGVEAHQAEVDELVGKHAIDWSLARMPVVDRALLRLATYELLFQAGVPMAAVISEAVSLAKAYSTDESAGFVNGVLAAVAREARPGT